MLEFILWFRAILSTWCNLLLRRPYRYIMGYNKAEKQPVGVLITGAAGQISYALVPMIARRVVLGANQPVILHLLDIPPAAAALNGVKMDLIDGAFPLLKGVVATTDVVEACSGVNIAFMLGGFPRKAGMERKDVMSKKVSICRGQVSALEQHAAADCKVKYIAFLLVYGGTRRFRAGAVPSTPAGPLVMDQYVSAANSHRAVHSSTYWALVLDPSIDSLAMSQLYEHELGVVGDRAWWSETLLSRIPLCWNLVGS